MLDPIPLGLAALALGAGLVEVWWRQGQARDAVDRWAQAHRYRLRRCERRWFTVGPPRPPSERWVSTGRFAGPIVFRVEVDDLQLGGTHTADVRCWVGRFGRAHEEVEVEWLSLGAPEASPPSAGLTRWEDAQPALLRRVAAGETAFRPADRHDAEAGRAFDELVEHLLALRRRGLVSFPDPLTSRGSAVARYAEVRDVALTDEGRRVAPGRP